MKLNLKLSVSREFFPADELSQSKIAKMKIGEEYTCDVKLQQNGALHRKIFSFFAFCTTHYYGDIEASKNEYYLGHVRKKLTIGAGYFKQVFERDGVSFELVPLSLNYNKMPPEVRSEFYSKVIDAAIKTVFDRTTDEATLEKLRKWF